MKTLLNWIYGLGAYLTGFVALLYFVGFSVGVLTPINVDSAGTLSPGWAGFVDLALIAGFGLQHSVMARPGFKAWLTRHVPAHLERSSYLVATTVALCMLIAFWQPVPGSLWTVEGKLLAGTLTGIALGGWGLVLLTTFLISHADLFGLRQIYLHARGLPYTPVAFKAPLLYRWVRHPMQLGVLIGIWSTPSMTVSHLLLAGGMTAYVLIGLLYEERDLVRQFGERYRAYQRSTPKLIPFGRARARRTMALLDD
ncbi:MAG: isoprenylcysteine carboxylmethyltransferase family protein [Thiobacillus sp.]|uniref:methyltransferase family protein n=1 Tax=Thiobacillus sp. TaxID=924 RepID=UPI00168C3E61|nr:NnrU family protein [Thiobacillus sp.]QLQ04138.1 MAG: isoprenylcysteine carboxylmethyltransferase family protein [Thiobacillus sp.]